MRFKTWRIEKSHENGRAYLSVMVGSAMMSCNMLGGFDETLAQIVKTLKGQGFNPP